MLNVNFDVWLWSSGNSFIVRLVVQSLQRVIICIFRLAWDEVSAQCNVLYHSCGRNTRCVLLSVVEKLEIAIWSRKLTFSFVWNWEIFQ